MKIKKTILRLIRIIQFNTICKIKGHNNYYGMYHNGFKKGTFNTNIEIPLYQGKCKRCNRFNGIKTTL